MIEINGINLQTNQQKCYKIESIHELKEAVRQKLTDPRHKKDNQKLIRLRVHFVLPLRIITF